MASVLRKYTPVGPSDNLLEKTVQAVATTTVATTSGCTIQVDDALDGVIETLDEVMASQGFAPDLSPGVDTSLTLQSPDGTTWAITVDDLGVISTA